MCPYIIFADFPNEFPGLMHCPWCGGKHWICLFIQLAHSHTWKIGIQESTEGHRAAKSHSGKTCSEHKGFACSLTPQISDHGFILSWTTAHGHHLLANTLIFLGHKGAQDYFYNPLKAGEKTLNKCKGLWINFLEIFNNICITSWGKWNCFGARMVKMF